jgi:hypothetical protein
MSGESGPMKDTPSFFNRSLVRLGETIGKGVIGMRKVLTWLERFFQSELECEVEEQLKKLKTILEGDQNRKSDDQKEYGEEKSLRDLALKVGASRYVYDEIRGYKSASIPHLSHNIHQALQTKSMIAAVKTTTRYVTVTALLAMVAFMSLVISLISLFRVH